MVKLNVLWLGRVAVFGVVLLFSVITLGLSAGYIAKLASFDFSAPDFAALALAISLLTLLTLIPMLVIDFLRRGAVSSWVMVELPVTGVLAILWLATAAVTANATNGTTLDCSVADEINSDSGALCHEYQGIEAFSFLNWIIVMVYFLGLLICAVIGQMKGNAPWKSAVRDANFFSKNAPAGAPMTQQWAANSYPPAPVQVVNV